MSKVQLKYDPADGEAFWEEISHLPGYPVDEFMPIRIMLYESNALYRLSEVIENVATDLSQPVLVVMDSTLMHRGSENLKPLILGHLNSQGWQIKPLILLPDSIGQVHTDMARIEAVRARLEPGVAVVALGSGTICDITKHACFLYEQDTYERPPFVVYQTANSVSAFTSNMAPTFIDGVKRTLSSRYPDALVCDLETLRDAPKEMTAAGVGDLLAIFVSLPDWFMAYHLGLDTGYSELAQHLMGPLDEILLSIGEEISHGSLEGMLALAKLNSLGGLAMSLSHATTPLSGYEHIMSHILDLLAEQSGRPLAQHGSQVALASILGAAAYQHFLAELRPSNVNVARCYPDIPEMEALVQQTFAKVDPSGKAGQECWADYRVKLEAWISHRPQFESFLDDWSFISEKLKLLSRSPERLISILRLIQAPLKFDELVPPASEEDVHFAFLNAPLMRRRLTLGDLLIFLGWDRDMLWSQLRSYVIRSHPKHWIN